MVKKLAIEDMEIDTDSYVEVEALSDSLKP